MEPFSIGFLIYIGLRMLDLWGRDGTLKKAANVTGDVIKGTAEVVGDLIDYAGEVIARVKTLLWGTVHGWMSSRRVSSGDVGRLLKERLGNGDYRVVCGVFSSGGTLRQKGAWECTEVDSELKRRMANGDTITINL